MTERCPYCNNEITEVFVFFAAGALRRTGPNSAVMDSGLSGFMNVGWHDHSGNHSGHVDIVEDAPNGQVEMYFCNESCLAGWFVRDVAGELSEQNEK